MRYGENKSARFHAITSFAFESDLCGNILELGGRKRQSAMDLIAMTEIHDKDGLATELHDQSPQVQAAAYESHGSDQHKYVTSTCTSTRLSR